MELAVPARVAVSALVPLLRRLFVAEGPGADVVDRPVRISGLVSFKGEKRVLKRRDLLKLSGELVRRTLASLGPLESPTVEVREELTRALARALHSLGDVAMDDVQAVRLGPAAFARELERPTDLSAVAEGYYVALLEAACEQILHFFTQRSTFVARTLLEQSRALAQLDVKAGLLLERTPSTLAEDARFEERYTAHMARTHNELTIHGVDLQQTREWPLDTAYLTLETTDGWGPALSADLVLAEHDGVLLRGGAGSGKTTLVQWLAMTAARQQQRYDEQSAHLLGRVPFVLPLRRVLQDGLPPTPDRFLHAVRSNLAGVQPAGWADRVLGSGRALMLVDGIDEIPAADRTATRRWIRDLVRDYPGNLWLVTARPSAVREEWLTEDGFAELSLAPMSRTNVRAFVHHWHTAAGAEPVWANRLISVLRSNSALGALAVNPLMCGLLCALHYERRGFLPHSRKDLYEAALSMLLERRDLERGVYRDGDLRLSRETQVQLLQKLAYWLIRNDQAEMDRTDALGQLDRALAYMAHLGVDAEELLDHLLERSGLLREPVPGRVDFVHRTFQDYLGAKAAVEEGDFPLLLNNADKTQWEDVARMAVALGRPAERARILNGLLDSVALEDVELADEHDTDDVRLAMRTMRTILLAASCLDQAVEIDPVVRSRVLEAIARVLPPRNVKEAFTLTWLGGPLVLGLLPGPDGLDDEVACNVVITATGTGADAALPLLTKYRAHRCPRVRAQLSWSWMYFDTDEYADEIIAHLAPENLYFTVHDLDQLRALRRLGGRPAVQIAFNYHPADLVRHLHQAELTDLWLLGDGLDGESMAWLGSFPRLKTVRLHRSHMPDTDIPGTVRVLESPRRSRNVPLD